MSFRARVVLAAVWLASLVAAGTMARGQAYEFQGLPEPIFVSGSDLAFRVEGWRGPVPAGRLVIRLNGQWVEPETAPLRPRFVR
jgi:hypothetical protein